MKQRTTRALSWLLVVSATIFLTACQQAPNASQSPPQKDEASIEQQAMTNYPEKPITIIVPFSAGGATDLAARILADHLPQYLGGGVVIVTNITGGSGTTGATEVAEAQADGYTLGCSAIAPLSIQPLFGTTTYTHEDITPICSIYSMPQVIVVAADAPYDTIEEFITFAKDLPQNSMNYAIAGRGTVQHLACANWLQEVGLTASDLTYNGGPEQATAILSGECEFGALQATDALSYVESGQLKILLNLSDVVPSVVADVPTCTSMGWRAGVGSCIGIWGPSEMDQEIIGILSDAIALCLQDETVIAQLSNLGIEADFMDSAAYGLEIQETSDTAQKLLTQMGLI